MTGMDVNSLDLTALLKDLPVSRDNGNASDRDIWTPFSGNLLNFADGLKEATQAQNTDEAPATLQQEAKVTSPSSSLSSKRKTSLTVEIEDPAQIAQFARFETPAAQPSPPNVMKTPGSEKSPAQTPPWASPPARHQPKNQHRFSQPGGASPDGAAPIVQPSPSHQVVLVRMCTSVRVYFATGGTVIRWTAYCHRFNCVVPFRPQMQRTLDFSPGRVTKRLVG